MRSGAGIEASRLAGWRAAEEEGGGGQEGRASSVEHSGFRGDQGVWIKAYSSSMPRALCWSYGRGRFYLC